MEANMFDYLDWRGNIRFSQCAFNEVDALLLSAVSYLDFSDIVPEMLIKKGIDFRLAMELYTNDEKRGRLGLILPDEIVNLAKKAAETDRFSGIHLSGFSDIVDEKIEMQFSAVTYSIDENEHYVSFRGTDDTLVGWKEDFNMSFMSAVPAQGRAVEYLNRAAAAKTGHIICGGHSKGGNLAVWAACFCENGAKKRLKKVFNFDGPGFLENLTETKEYSEIKNIIYSYIPQSSIVGILLNHIEDYTIVKSRQSFVFQHDPLSWLVMGDKFVYAEERSSFGEKSDEKLQNWISSMSKEERHLIAESVYEAVSSTGAKTLSDLTGFKNIAALNRAFLKLDKEKRKKLFEVIRRLIGRDISTADDLEKTGE